MMKNVKILFKSGHLLFVINCEGVDWREFVPSTN
jgi:hypothetical protein